MEVFIPQEITPVTTYQELSDTITTVGEMAERLDVVAYPVEFSPALATEIANFAFAVSVVDRGFDGTFSEEMPYFTVYESGIHSGQSIRGTGRGRFSALDTAMRAGMDRVLPSIPRHPVQRLKTTLSTALEAPDQRTFDMHQDDGHMLVANIQVGPSLLRVGEDDKEYEFGSVILGLRGPGHRILNRERRERAVRHGFGNPSSIEPRASVSINAALYYLFKSI